MTNQRLLRLIREELRQLSEGGAPFEQCGSCSDWFPIDAVQWDENSQEWVCVRCYPIQSLW